MFVVVVRGNLMISGKKSDDFRGECFIGSGRMDAPALNTEPCAYVIVSVAAHWSILVSGGGAPRNVYSKIQEKISFYATSYENLFKYTATMASAARSTQVVAHKLLAAVACTARR